MAFYVYQNFMPNMGGGFAYANHEDCGPSVAPHDALSYGQDGHRGEPAH